MKIYGFTNKWMLFWIRYFSSKQQMFQFLLAEKSMPHYSIVSILLSYPLLLQKAPSNFINSNSNTRTRIWRWKQKAHAPQLIMFTAYTTPSTVREVSATFVATMKRRQFGGAGANTLTCMRSVQNQKCCIAWKMFNGRKEKTKYEGRQSY